MVLLSYVVGWLLVDIERLHGLVVLFGPTRKHQMIDGEPFVFNRISQAEFRLDLHNFPEVIVSINDVAFIFDC